ncbi:MAG: DUF2948 family protein [Rhodovibrionaceae bacterium]
MPNIHRMKLRARDGEDLRVLAAFLQDAILPVKEMAYLPQDRRFVMLFNRFKWERLPEEGPVAALESAPEPEHGAEAAEEDVAFLEDAEETGPVYERVHCALTFDAVGGAQLRGIDRKDKSRLLELLTIEADKDGIALVFAGEAAIRLQARKVRAHMEDMGEPWPTTNLPRHTQDRAGAPD